MRFSGEAFQERSGQSRFANTGLPRKQHHLTLAGPCLRPAPQEQFEFFFAPDEFSQFTSVQSFKAAFD
jgi:hypothetical protein